MEQQQVIEDKIPLAVEIVDLVADMLSADAKRSYMEKRIAKLISEKDKQFDYKKWHSEYLIFCEKRSTPGYAWGSFAADVFTWLSEEKFK